MATSWTWLSAEPNGVLAALTAIEADVKDREKMPTPSDLPVALCSVVLVMELALVSGATFLLVLTSSVAATVVRGLLRALVDDNLVGVDVVGPICESAAFGWGLVTFMSWFFRRPMRDLVRRFTGFGWSGMKTCAVSMLLQSVAVTTLTLAQRQTEGQVLVAWENVESAVRRPDGSLAMAEMTQNLLLAPMKEELFFRGVIVLVVMNRLQSVMWSASLSSLLFAAIHLANSRRIGTHYSASYVAFQVLWASLVGLFLALKLAVSGSLVECFALHVINNVFALGMSRTIAMDLTQPLACVYVLAALAIYLVAIAKHLLILRRRTTSHKQL